jgi:glycosyltransferase involved in cell wall biosynthesis
MKICILTTLHAPDDDRIFYKEALSLREAFPDVTIVAPHTESADDFKGSGIRLVALKPRRGLAGRLLMLVEAVRAVRGLRPDVCHFHDYDQVPLAPLLRWRRPTRLIYDAHEAYPEQMLNSQKVPAPLRGAAARLVDWVEKKCARSCALVICADDATRDSFSRRGIPARTIFNYPPLSLFSQSAPGEGARPERYRGREVLLYQGTMSRVRGLFQMIEAMALIRESRPQALLLLIGLGPGPLRTEAEEKARGLGLENSVEFVSWVPHTELARHIGYASVGLVPWLAVAKHKMNIPIKLFEYWACGIPVVASDLPSFRDYVIRSQGGRLYDPSRIQDLASAALTLLENEEEGREMGERGRRWVQHEWNWAPMETALIACYRDLQPETAAAAGARGS